MSKLNDIFDDQILKIKLGVKPQAAALEAKQQIKELFLELIDATEKDDMLIYPNELRQKVEAL